MSRGVELDLDWRNQMADKKPKRDSPETPKPDKPIKPQGEVDAPGKTPPPPPPPQNP